MWKWILKELDVSSQVFKSLSTSASLKHCHKQKLSDAKVCKPSDCFEGGAPARWPGGGPR